MLALDPHVVAADRISVLVNAARLLVRRVGVIERLHRYGLPRFSFRREDVDVGFVGDLDELPIVEDAVAGDNEALAVLGYARALADAVELDDSFVGNALGGDHGGPFR